MINLEQVDDAAQTSVLLDMNQRKHSRYLCLDGGVMRLSVRPEFHGRRALLVDLSAGGIGFVLKDALEAGAMLVFELRAPPGAEAIGRIARVRHCRPHPTPAGAPWARPRSAVARLLRGALGLKEPAPPSHAWLVGCEFDRPLNEDEVKQFVEHLRSIGGNAV